MGVKKVGRQKSQEHKREVTGLRGHKGGREDEEEMGQKLTKRLLENVLMKPNSL